MNIYIKTDKQTDAQGVRERMREKERHRERETYREDREMRGKEGERMSEIK